MLKLITNEFAKIFHRKGTYVLLVLVLLFGVLTNVVLKMDSSYETYDENGQVITESSNKKSPEEILKEDLTSTKAAYDLALKGGDKFEITSAKQAYELVKYQVDNNITAALVQNSTTVDSNNEFLKAFYRTPSVMSLISILMIIIAAGMIAREFSDGTIKFLLINPVSRAKIFWSKYLTCIIMSIASSVVFFVFMLIVSAIFNGADGIGGSYVYYANDTVQSYSALLYVAKRCGYTAIGILASFTLSFAISSLLRSSSLAIGLSLGVEMAGSTISAMLLVFGQDWGRYLIFSNTDLESIASGSSLYANQTVPFALGVIGVHMIVFLLAGYDAFTRREV